MHAAWAASASASGASDVPAVCAALARREAWRRVTPAFRAAWSEHRDACHGALESTADSVAGAVWRAAEEAAADSERI